MGPVRSHLRSLHLPKVLLTKASLVNLVKALPRRRNMTLQARVNRARHLGH